MVKTRKNRTRGWKKEKPDYRQRTVMLKKCGKKCFLGTKQSFPICRKNTCKISSKGLYSAFIRSRQYRSKGKKYRNISKKANKMLVSLGFKR